MRVFCSCVGTAHHFTKKHQHNLVSRTLNVNCVNTFRETLFTCSAAQGCRFRGCCEVVSPCMSMCVWETVTFTTWTDLSTYSCQTSLMRCFSSAPGSTSKCGSLTSHYPTGICWITNQIGVCRCLFRSCVVRTHYVVGRLATPASACFHPGSDLKVCVCRPGLLTLF